MQDVIRMTYDVALCHPDEITKIWSLSHPDDLAIPSISSGWLIVDAWCHPDDLPGVGISSGWVTANSLCHPDDILFHFMSPGWLNWGWFLIRMSYGNVIMSSGWDTLPFLSHPDEIANFDFPQHAVALQRFRNTLITNGNVNQLHLAPVDIKMKHIIQQFTVSIPRALLYITDKCASTMGINSLPVPNVWSKSDPPPSISTSVYIQLGSYGYHSYHIQLFCHRCCKIYFHDISSIVITVRSMMVYGNPQVKSAGTQRGVQFQS